MRHAARLTLAILTIAALAGPRLAAAQDAVAIATASHAVLGSVTVENEDIALCRLTSTGFQNTHCNWSILFDGSAAGLNTSVRSLDILPNGSLVIGAAADNSIPD